VLVIKDECGDALAAKRRSSILDNCARRDPGDLGNPAQSSGESLMTTIEYGHFPAEKVDAYLVSEHARIGTLPRHFGSRMMLVEDMVYGFMRRFVSSYDGGLWNFYELSNGGFYMAPTVGPVRFSVYSYGFDDTLSADAAGIVVCLFAFSHLSFQRPQTDVFTQHFHRLRHFALNHKEAALIFAAID
jgi:hypothetical protein